ncbi:PAS domain-containing sensor histidine kinase [Pontibacter sp. 13R65]|uniref:PAS domain-containing sensor histidine kinase n=1 Tax=Pontibacter sp. 13R65 TaxID=3127458 RepID=UPI00301D048F
MENNPTPSSAIFQALVEQTGQSFFVYAVNSNRFTYLSPAFEQAFSINKSNFDNPSELLALIYPEDQEYVAQKYKWLLEDSVLEAFEFRIKLANQQEQWICIKPSVFKEANGQLMVIGHAENITAQKHYNDVLKKYSNKKNAVLNILSHDLAGPLSNIQSLAFMLAEEVQQDSRARHLVGIIRQSSQQGVQLIQNFIDQEFLESLEADVITRRVNIVSKIKEATAEYQRAQKELIPRVFGFSASSDEIYVELDDNKFIQVINNLISNSIKFTADGDYIAVSIEEQPESVLVKVEDNGVGIPKKYHATLFDKFTNARRPGLKGEPTTGLGMSIIKTIVEWHKGQIWFESEEGKGTCFYIELPKQ